MIVAKTREPKDEQLCNAVIIDQVQEQVPIEIELDTISVESMITLQKTVQY